MTQIQKEDLRQDSWLGLFRQCPGKQTKLMGDCCGLKEASQLGIMNEPLLDWGVVNSKAVQHLGGKFGKFGDDVRELLLVSLGMIMVLWLCRRFMLKCHKVCYFQMAQQNQNKKYV